MTPGFGCDSAIPTLTLSRRLTAVSWETMTVYRDPLGFMLVVRPHTDYNPKSSDSRRESPRLVSFWRSCFFCGVRIRKSDAVAESLDSVYLMLVNAGCFLASWHPNFLPSSLGSTVASRVAACPSLKREGLNGQVRRCSFAA